MVMYAVEYEVSLDREDDSPFAKFTAFDSESFNVELVAGICSGQDLRDLGDLLDIATKELDRGTAIGSTIEPDVKDYLYDCSLCQHGSFDVEDGITNCDIDGEDKTYVKKVDCNKYREDVDHTVKFAEGGYTPKCSGCEYFGEKMGESEIMYWCSKHSGTTMTNHCCEDYKEKQ